MAGPSIRCFPHQGAKLSYLIDVHGDRRERSRANSTLAKDAADGGHPRDLRSPIVVNQAGLAAFLEVRPEEVSRWCNDKVRFPDRLLGELCRLYDISEGDFRTLSYVSFVATYGDPTTISRIGESALSIVFRLLLRAASGHAEILMAPPTDDAPDDERLARLRYATARDPNAVEPLPEVAQNAPFWVRLVSPQRSDAALTWAGWHLALLNYDLHRDGFRALLPRETNDPAHWSDRVPATGMLTLPRAHILRHEAPDLGEFGIVAVLTRDPVPPSLLDALGQEQAHGLALEPVLDELTAHLATAVQGGRAAIAVARYRVIPPHEGGSGG